MTCTTRAAETWAHILEQPDGYPMGVAADFATDDGSEPAEACAAVETVAQQHLDAHPDDHRARRLLGEWLQWHGDVRGEGYRALAACKRYPDERTEAERFPFQKGGEPYTLNTMFGRIDNDSYRARRSYCLLPVDWFQAVREFAPSSWLWWAEWSTRCTAEDAAALAFARLPAERRAALLRGEM